MRAVGTLFVLGLCFKFFTMPLYGEVEWALPASNLEVSVQTDAELNLAIQEIRAGDRIVLEDGTYNGIILSRFRGTADQPIVIMARNSRQAIIVGTKSGRNAKITDCEYLYFYGVRFTGSEVWGVTIGPAFSGDDKSLGSRHIRLIDCEIDHSGQSLLSISGGSRDIAVIDCELHDSGIPRGGANKPYAEGIYIGDGAALNDRTHDIVIKGNRFYRIGNDDNSGEAIDVKCQSYDVRIVGNTIEDVVVDSGGAISVLFDAVDYPEGHTDPRIVVSKNQIRGVRPGVGGSNGAGICVGANGILVEANTVEATEGPAFLAFANAANTSGRVRVHRNTFKGRIEVNTYGHSEIKTPVTVEFRSNQINTQGTLE